MSLGPEEGDLKLRILKLQRKKLEATQNLQLRAAPPLPADCENWTISCKTVLSLCPPSPREIIQAV